MRWTARYYQVVEFQHVKPGKGAAFVRTKMKNVVTGAVTETSFNPTAKFEEAFIERKDMEYSYNDGDLYYFMDQETYDMVPLNTRHARRCVPLRQGEHDVQDPVPSRATSSASSPPTSLTLSVTETEPGLAGNTATNITQARNRSRPARRSRCRSSSTIGDKIQIDTRTGEYIGRAK